MKRITGKHWFFLVAIIVILAVTAGTINFRFFSVRNILNILEQVSVLGIVAAGATILIISGNFDISVGSMIGLAACTMAIALKSGMNEVLVGFVGVGVCVASSLLNGILTTRLGAPSFIISLATTGVFHGAALVITEGVIQTVYEQFQAINNTNVFGFLPLMFVISILGYLFVSLILRNTKLGRRVYAIGANRRAAFLSGIAVEGNTLVFFALNGLLVGIASVVLLSRLGAALPTTGAGLELKAIGAVVIGGVPITGGTGNILGTFLGVLLIGVISNMLNLSRVNPYYQEIAYGALVVISVAVSYVRIGARRES
ncbi:MAG: ABC transporter permease [Spirochaetales bacterium]|nr:ABC transporter permease [Spirochaetales bacterium]